jgi:cellulose synthase/poly-beta-1,6-N-acetylglucosamine synthase-like glycosyltransferase
MTTVEGALLGVYAYVVGWWVVRYGMVALALRWLDSLTLRSPRYDQPDPPLVSAIIPARNEERELAGCLASVQAQSYPNLEILVVDDRSTDRTGAIARAMAAEDGRVRALSVASLPEGWTGKSHALHVAAAQARGEWLWFLDADTRHEPASLAIVLEYARAHGAALASLLPEMRCVSFWERAVQPLMGVVLMRSFPLFLVNRDGFPLAFANGQFILIRRSAYDAVGGHAAVRDRFVEDIHLARRVKALGLPIRVAIGVGISSTRMYSSLPELIRGWSRILYDAVGRRALPLLWKIVEPLIFTQTVFAASALAVVLLALGRRDAYSLGLLGLALLHLVLQYAVMVRFYRLQSPKLARATLWYPLAVFVSDWILLQALRMCWTGRVRWRGTEYGPAERAVPVNPVRSAPRSDRRTAADGRRSG